MQCGPGTRGGGLRGGYAHCTSVGETRGKLLGGKLLTTGSSQGPWGQGSCEQQREQGTPGHWPLVPPPCSHRT